MVTFATHRSLAEELERAFSLQSLVDKSLKKAGPTPSQKTILSGALYHLSCEHASSMLLLIEAKKVGSALALARPAYDALLRGAWVSYCASADQIEQISDKKADFPGNKDISAGVEKAAPAELRSTLSVMHRAVPVAIRHGLTHGGVEQLMHRFDGTTIRANFSSDTVIGFVRLATLVMLGSAIGIARQPGGDLDPIDVLHLFLSSFTQDDTEARAMIDRLADEC
ncbi:DUF6988 family protein [Parapusillimonas sp. JC17]|uniref:DUF6988 family protein n=1 Tax=Parapusillimonas sp. JC17 TaxID=3445768 RepID=UPI003FA07CB4